MRGLRRNMKLIEDKIDANNINEIIDAITIYSKSLCTESHKPTIYKCDSICSTCMVKCTIVEHL